MGRQYWWHTVGSLCTLAHMYFNSRWVFNKGIKSLYLQLYFWQLSWVIWFAKTVCLIVIWIHLHLLVVRVMAWYMYGERKGWQEQFATVSGWKSREVDNNNFKAEQVSSTWMNWSLENWLLISYVFSLQLLQTSSWGSIYVTYLSCHMCDVFIGGGRVTD